MGPSATQLAESLALNLRSVRQARGLTQGRLARLCGIPRSTIANLETGAGNPTLSVLARIAAALRLSIEEMISAPRGRCELFPKGTLPTLERGRTGATFIHKLLPHPIPGMEIDRMEIGVGERIAGVPHRPGTQEYLYCESGRIALSVAGDRFDLSAGDVAAFPGDTRHSYQNPGPRPAVGFSVVTLAPTSSAKPNRLLKKSVF
ncbi:MAG: helix-turn-helix domain-containing protein [Deltaproteobacteria bacterium]|nr:helix-turn-helix domain-containing protein [Deltaproteobacteria bacterium]